MEGVVPCEVSPVGKRKRGYAVLLLSQNTRRGFEGEIWLQKVGCNTFEVRRPTLDAHQAGRDVPYTKQRPNVPLQTPEPREEVTAGVGRGARRAWGKEMVGVRGGGAGMCRWVRSFIDLSFLWERSVRGVRVSCAFAVAFSFPLLCLRNALPPFLSIAEGHPK